MIGFNLTDAFSAEQMVPLGIVLLAIYLLMSSLRKRRERQSDQEPRDSTLRAGAAPANDSQRMRRDLESLIVELQELSRTISAQIDTRFAKMEAVMRDADRRIATLTRLTRDAEDHARQAEGRIEGDSSVPTDQDVRHTVVYELADGGASAVEIAKRLGRTTGEIELILNLRPKSHRVAPKRR